MRIAVTGSSGFVGTYVMRELLSHGHEAIGVDIREPASDAAGSAEFRLADLKDSARTLVSAASRLNIALHNRTEWSSLQ